MNSIAKEVQQLFLNKNITLSVAESITGGAISRLLVLIPGCSEYFLGSVIAYSNFAKEKILGVNETTLASFGSVSEAVAKEMALGSRTAFGATYGLATTGIAGPTGGSQKKPIGTVSFAMIGPDKEFLWTSHFAGTREEIIEKATIHALEQLFFQIKGL